MKRLFVAIGVVLGCLLYAGAGMAHFGMVIPSDNMVMQDDRRAVDVTLSFSHPFEGIGMALVRPKVFRVVANGQSTDLLSNLKPDTVMDHGAWTATYPIQRPGVYQFVMEPQPYWEPAEDCFIIHYTKTVVTAFGDDEGWDAEVGLPTEIVPLAKPYGLWAGNVFQGIVKVNGKAVPFSEVEVEYYNEQGNVTAPTDYMITQTIRTDANGLFTYAAPWKGWWGFAALTTADRKMEHDGEEKEIEQGAVIWVKFE